MPNPAIQPRQLQVTLHGMTAHGGLETEFPWYGVATREAAVAFDLVKFFDYSASEDHRNREATIVIRKAETGSLIFLLELGGLTELAPPEQFGATFTYLRNLFSGQCATAIANFMALVGILEICSRMTREMLKFISKLDVSQSDEGSVVALANALSESPIPPLTEDEIKRIRDVVRLPRIAAIVESIRAQAFYGSITVETAAGAFRLHPKNLDVYPFELLGGRGLSTERVTVRETYLRLDCGPWQTPIDPEADGSGSMGLTVAFADGHLIPVVMTDPGFIDLFKINARDWDGALIDCVIEERQFVRNGGLYNVTSVVHVRRYCRHQDEVFIPIGDIRAPV